MAAFEVDEYVVAVLMRDLIRHDRHPSAFLLYFFLWWRTRGQRRLDVPLSLDEISRETGLAKRTIQDARRLLVRRKLLSVSRGTPTSVPIYRVLRPWKRKPQ